MRWWNVFSKVGLLVFFLSSTMVIPICFSIYYGDYSYISFLKSIGLSLFVGFILYFCFRYRKNYKKNYKEISQREGIAIVSLGWVIISLLGGLPFYFSSFNFSFTDSFFESVSGFTTTGSSIIEDIESLPNGLILWRNFIQWLGGMGIIVLSIAILPRMKISGEKLYKAEVPSPMPDKLKPKIRDTAIILWKVYVFFSIIEIVLLLIFGMSFFEALCHSLSTMPSGGFSTFNKSLGHFDCIKIDIIIVFFMILSGINFSLHYQMLKGNTLIFFRDSECKFFFILCLIMILLVTTDIYGKVYINLFDSFRYSIFQVVSILTTTGFITADYSAWPPMSQMIIFICMFIGSSAGSTGGGIKCFRLILCFKYCYKELFSIIHPRAITRIKINGQPVTDRIIRSIFGFLSLYLLLFVISSVILTGMGLDFLSATSSVAASIGNIGPGFGIVGPTNNYISIPLCGKWLLSFCMLLGRLEIYTLIVLFFPEFWRK